MSARTFIFLLVLLWLPGLVFADWEDWWLTPDQQGARLMNQDLFQQAAEAFEDPMQKGVAFFRAGDFETAASVFGRIRSPEAVYNRANALLMLGRYQEAIAGYDSALEFRPQWEEAEENRAIATARLERLAPPDSDAGGTGGQLGADEIVFDDSGRVDKGGSEVEASGAEEVSDDEMRAVWLRRVQNDPAEFLRTRFAYQLYRDEQESTEDGDEPDAN
jgi:Ca-activated chloride channel family protein